MFTRLELVICTRCRFSAKNFMCYSYIRFDLKVFPSVSEERGRNKWNCINLLLSWDSFTLTRICVTHLFPFSGINSNTSRQKKFTIFNRTFMYETLSFLYENFIDKFFCFAAHGHIATVHSILNSFLFGHMSPNFCFYQFTAPNMNFYVLSKDAWEIFRLTKCCEIYRKLLNMKINK